MNEEGRKTAKLGVIIGLLLLLLGVIAVIVVKNIIVPKEVGIEKEEAVSESKTLPKVKETRESEFLGQEEVSKKMPLPQLEREKPLKELKLKDLPLKTLEETEEAEKAEKEVFEQEGSKKTLELHPPAKELRRLKKGGVIIY